MLGANDSNKGYLVSGNNTLVGPPEIFTRTVIQTDTGTNMAKLVVYYPELGYWDTAGYSPVSQASSDQLLICGGNQLMQNQTTGLYEIFIFDLIERKLVNNTALVGEAKTPDDAKMKAVVKAVEDGLIKSADIDSYQIIIRFIGTLEPTPEGATSRAAANKQSK